MTGAGSTPACEFKSCLCVFQFVFPVFNSKDASRCTQSLHQKELIFVLSLYLKNESKMIQGQHVKIGNSNRLFIFYAVSSISVNTLKRHLYLPCWMTVSPAMWVTGNMASNMSLKETETGKENGCHLRIWICYLKYRVYLTNSRMFLFILFLL